MSEQDQAMQHLAEQPVLAEPLYVPDLSKYEVMVKQLAKPGDAVIADMTPTTAHLLHMAIGFSGEIGELIDVVSPLVLLGNPLDRPHALEELGDADFYLTGVIQGVPDYESVFVSELLNHAPLLHLCLGATVAASNLLDLAKKAALYAKPGLADKFTYAIGECSAYMNAFRVCLGISQDEARAHNMTKLIGGKDARYKEGFYSNKAAQERSDKAAGE